MNKFMELSENNPKIKYLLRLSQRQFRQKEKSFIIEGVRFVEELLSSKITTKSIYYSNKLQETERGQALLQQINESKITSYQINHSLLRKIADTESPQGVLALAEMPEDALEKIISHQTNPLFVLVDGVQDPGNLGSIIRSADAAGADGVILLKGTVDLYNAKTLRATMGSIFHLPIEMGAEETVTLSLLAKYSVSLMVGDPREGEPIHAVNLCQSVALVVGNEAHGPSERIKNQAQVKLTIPMPGNAESLNVAVSCGIMLYEAVRQRSL